MIAASNNFLMAEATVDFMIHGLLKYRLFGQDLWLTTTHVSMVLVTLLLIFVAFLMNRKIKAADASKEPSTLQNVAELAVELLDQMVHTVMGDNAKKFANYIGTVFAFILFSNFSALLGLRSPTADYGVTFALGIMTFILIQYVNIKNNKFGAFKSLFQPIPLFFPINLIGELATPVSLSLRLFGNILSGTVIMALIYSLFPVFVKIGLPSALHIYFDIFSGLIQTYVFCMLTMVFVTNKVTASNK